MRYGRYSVSRPHPKFFPIKERLNIAFKSLRKFGLVTKQSFMCCGSCASYEIGQQMHKSKRNPIGCVFYSRQGYEGLAVSGDVCLSYFANTPKETPFEETYGPTEKIGQLVLDAMLAAGLDATWTGSHVECVIVNGLIEDRPAREAEEAAATEKKRRSMEASASV